MSSTVRSKMKDDKDGRFIETSKLTGQGKTTIPMPVRQVKEFVGGNWVAFIVYKDWTIEIQEYIEDNEPNGEDVMLVEKSKMTPDGKVTVPSVIRQSIDLEKGDLLSFTVYSDWTVTMRKDQA